MATDQPPVDVAAQLAVCRRRIATLERVMEHWVEVMEATARDRETAFQQVVAALTQDFREAIICDADMTEEQRAAWLRQAETPDA